MATYNKKRVSFARKDCTIEMYNRDVKQNVFG